MLLRALLDFVKPCSRRAPTGRAGRPLARRPRLETLEDRSVPAGASGWIADPVGDFLPSYTGPHHPGLDVTAHRVTVNPERVIIPANFGLEKGVWFPIEQGIRGIVVRDEQQRPHVYMLTQKASESYLAMTKHDRAPVLVEQEI